MPLGIVPRLLAAFFGLSLCVPIAPAADWPMLGRDATRNAVSAEKNPPIVWQTGEEEKNVKWKASLGSISFSDPVVAGGLVWIGTNSVKPGEFRAASDASVLLCLRESDGRPLYRYESPRLPEGRVHDWPLASMACSPLVENDRLWFTTNRGEVVCLDIGPVLRSKDKRERLPEDDAKTVWKLDLMKDLGVFFRGTPMMICHTCSIAGRKNYIYVITGHGAPYEKAVPNPEAPSLVCLDKRTGKVVWQDNSPGENILHGQWASPLVIEVNGQAQVIAPQGDGWLRSFDAETGKPLWWFDMNSKESQWRLTRSTRNTILATPVYYDGRVYLGSGLHPEHGEGRGRLCSIDPAKRGDISSELAVDAEGTPLAHRRMQAVDTTHGEKVIANPNSGLVWEFTSVGKEFEDTMHGTVTNVAIDQRLLIAADYSGAVHCLDAKTGSRHWSHDVLSAILASPLIVDGNVYVGDEDGKITVFALEKEKKVLAEEGNRLDHSVYISPIFANGVLYVGSGRTLYAMAQNDAAPQARKIVGGHWPQWRGPKRDNVSTETGLLTEWPEAGPPLVWQVKGLGEGIHPVSVADGRIYTLGSQEREECVVALDEQTGNLLWTTKVATDLPLQSRLMRWLSQRSPTVDADRLYTVTAVGDLICLQATDGKELWRKNFPEEFGGRPGVFGFCDRPLIDGDNLICKTGSADAAVVALNKKTGNVVWKTAYPENKRGTYGALVVSEGGGVRQFVGFREKELAGIAAADGRVLWRYGKNSARITNTSTPIAVGDLIVSANGYGGGLAILKLSGENGKIVLDEQHFSRPGFSFDPFTDSTAVVDGYLYATGGSGLPTCIEVASGKVMWQARPNAGRGKIAFIYADGHLYCRFQDGTMTLVPATPEKYVEKGHFTIPDHVESSGATFPVIAGGRLYLRDNNNLFCYDIRRTATDAAYPKPRTIVLHPVAPSEDDERFWKRVAERGINRGPDAIWVPTPDDVVEKMLELAGVKKGEVVYDLGSGDGRVVIAAAKKYGAKATGVEIDPEMVKISLAKVHESKLANLVKIDRADIFQTDLSKADVVAVYLPPKLLARLRRQFEKMKPGSRLVSHYFELPGTPPDRTLTVESAETGEAHKIHVWTLPFKKRDGEN
jgi:outer membrane protein assembly factor BamB